LTSNRVAAFLRRLCGTELSTARNASPAEDRGCFYAPGKQADQIVVSGTPPGGTSVGRYPTTVTVTGLAPPAKPPSFAIIVGA
jgi:hypothetical protein